MSQLKVATKSKKVERVFTQIMRHPDYGAHNTYIESYTPALGPRAVIVAGWQAL